jgi:primosomal protein N' (replication factor Y)
VYLHLPDRIMGHRTRITEQAEREGLTTNYHEDPDDGEALTIELPPVTLVDMREELKAGNASMFSRALMEALTATLNRNEQAILLLNRRGASTYVFCRDCGFVLHCPRCDSPLTYHNYSTTLRCHHCGYEGANVTVCPNCQSNRIKFFGAGTQQLEAEVQKHFPQTRIVRWDSDTASNAEMHDAILGRFLEHQADVMVGTQLVAKGLDLPRVTLVGVISADTGLNLPDFRAGERTFQLLTQVAGRAGRALPGGRVILQTYQPDHYAIKAASKHDYAGFYAQELQFRRELGYPPFRRLAMIEFRHQREIKARDEAQRAAAILQQRIHDLGLTATELIGPAPCFFSRVNDQYRWHLLIRSPNPARLLEDFDPPHGWYIDLDPVDLL